MMPMSTSPIHDARFFTSAVPTTVSAYLRIARSAPSMSNKNMYKLYQASALNLNAILGGVGHQSIKGCYFQNHSIKSIDHSIKSPPSKVL